MAQAVDLVREDAVLAGVGITAHDPGGAAVLKGGGRGSHVSSRQVVNQTPLPAPPSPHQAVRAIRFCALPVRGTPCHSDVIAPVGVGNKEQIKERMEPSERWS